MSLANSLALEVNAEATFVAKVLKKSDLVSYQAKGNTTREYFIINVADTTKPATLRVYQKNQLPKLKVGRTYQFKKVLRKFGDSDFWAIWFSEFCQVPQLNVPDDVETQALAGVVATQSNVQANATTMKRKLNEALYSGGTSEVTAKIVMVNIKYVYLYNIYLIK
jgi:hypothetical protein